VVLFIIDTTWWCSCFVSVLLLSPTYSVLPWVPNYCFVVAIRVVAVYIHPSCLLLLKSDFKRRPLVALLLLLLLSSLLLLLWFVVVVFVYVVIVNIPFVRVLIITTIIMFVYMTFCSREKVVTKQAIWLAARTQLFDMFVLKHMFVGLI